MGSIDLYGKLLGDCWNGGSPVNTEEVLEFEDGTVDRGAAMRYFEEASASPIDYWCIDGREVGDYCIDIGVGAGRFAVDLIKQRNEKVLGLEISPGATAIARNRGVDAICVDYEQFTPDVLVDTLFLLGNNLGLLGYGSLFAKRLRRLRSWCRPGSVLYGTAGRPGSLPEPVRGLVSASSPGTFRSRLHYGGQTEDVYEYTFLDPEQFVRDMPLDAWSLREVHSIDGRWAVALEAV